MPSVSQRTLPAALVLLVSLGACAPRPVEPGPRPDPGPGPPPEPALRAVPYVPISPALPPIPRVEGPLGIGVVYPTPDTPRPRTDSTAVWGSVGTGGAALAINGIPVPVAPNGAFVAFLPVPEDGRFELVARAGGREARHALAYAPPQAARPAPVEPDTAAPAAPAAPARTVFPRPLPAAVTGGADTLATGSDAAVGRPTPTGTYRWFFPRGASLVATERRGAQLRVQLDSATAAWVGASAVTLADTGTMVMSAATLGRVEVRPAAGWVDVRVRAAHLPFLVEPEGAGLVVTLYRAAPGEAPRPASDPFLRGITLEPTAGGSTRMRIALAGAPWGYKAFYEPDGTLVLRVRRPPAIDPAQPLRGIRIVVDPGHPPAGTTGPTGMREAESTLAIALPLAELLRARGAEVHLTPSDN
ncbi:MAG TPA: hypothetical protein VHG28_12890, partial [Longimicrobiaceae bacterium]|nr:hypothetical protein [Longimicrobiaceae bacterium]